MDLYEKILENYHSMLFFSPGYTDATGCFHKEYQEFFFLPDPDQLKFTHFPHDPTEPDYAK